MTFQTVECVKGPAGSPKMFSNFILGSAFQVRCVRPSAAPKCKCYPFSTELIDPNSVTSKCPNLTATGTDKPDVFVYHFSD